MLAIDSNILVYAHRADNKFHDKALSLLLDLVEGDRFWAIPWPCIYEFYGVVTNPTIWGRGTSTIEETLVQLEYWMNSPSVRLLSETNSFETILLDILESRNVKGAVIQDARIAAICLAHGVEKLITADRDFHLFPELSIQNPFV